LAVTSIPESIHIDCKPGKSSLTVQFVDGHFVESYYPTIENTFSKIIKFKGQEFATEIIDTAGQVSRIDKHLVTGTSVRLYKSSNCRAG
jgi:GTPase SAR1 family protein